MQDKGSGGLCDTRRGVVSGALQESKCIAASLTFAGPGANIDCLTEESVVMNNSGIAELPALGMDAMFTAM